MSSDSSLQRSALGIVLGLALLGTVSCAQEYAATAPSIVTPAPPAAPAAPAPVAEAKVVVDVFEVRLEDPSSIRYWYRQRVVLRETGGNSGALLSSLRFVPSTGEGSEVLTGECFGGADVVPRSGTWSTDAIYYYCLGFGTRSDLAGKSVLMTVDYFDEAGRKGSVTATAQVN